MLIFKKMKTIYWIFYLGVIISVFDSVSSISKESININGEAGEVDAYSDEYEYYSEDSYEAVNVEVETKERPQGYGFLKPVGNSVIRELKPLMNPQFMNYSKENFHCLPKSEARIKTSEEEERLRKEEEIAQLAKNNDQLSEQRDVFRNEINTMMKTREDLKARRQTGKLKRKHYQDVVAGIESNLTAVMINATEQLNATAVAANETTVPTINETEVKTLPSGRTVVKKLTFREKLIQKLKINEEASILKDSKVQKFLLGSDCESLVCGACKMIVEEFAVAVYDAIENPKIKYIEQVFNNFCSSKQITKKYDDIVAHICSNYFMDGFTGYEEALLQPFEEDNDWENILSSESLQTKAMAVCLDVGACSEEQFELNVVPLHRDQEQWGDKCFVCQAFANELEERLVLLRHVSEQDVREAVVTTCDRLNLEEEYDALCRELIRGPQGEVIMWNAKVHEEAVQRQAKGTMRFADSLCEEAKFCEKWIPQALFNLKQDIKEVATPVFS